MPERKGRNAVAPFTSGREEGPISSFQKKSQSMSSSTKMKPPLEKPSLTQLYTCVVLVLDLFLLFLVWINPTSSRLTKGTMWFDNTRYDRHQTVVLFTLIMITVVLSSVFALWNRFNRWVLLNHAIVETVRLSFFVFLLSRLEHPRNRHTIILALMLLNVVIHTHNWYSTWCLLFQNAK